jgi:hypothetical protein
MTASTQTPCHMTAATSQAPCCPTTPLTMLPYTTFTPTRPPPREPSFYAPVCIHDGVEPVCDGEHRGGREHTANGRLDEAVCPRVNAGCGLVKHQHAAVAQHGTRHAEQLLLALQAGGSTQRDNRQWQIASVTFCVVPVAHKCSTPYATRGAAGLYPVQPINQHPAHHQLLASSTAHLAEVVATINPARIQLVSQAADSVVQPHSIPQLPEHLLPCHVHQHAHMHTGAAALCTQTCIKHPTLIRMY